MFDNPGPGFFYNSTNGLFDFMELKILDLPQPTLFYCNSGTFI